ncbi:hypothetical protein KCP71_15665 [Salmonella enterica subsp. enterica]|nr:hypothetical protein KCP71_15665 [Salmonella enterica subsp. enterica]
METSSLVCTDASGKSLTLPQATVFNRRDRGPTRWIKTVWNGAKTMR